MGHGIGVDLLIYLPLYLSTRNSRISIGLQQVCITCYLPPRQGGISFQILLGKFQVEVRSWWYRPLLMDTLGYSFCRPSKCSFENCNFTFWTPCEKALELLHPACHNYLAESYGKRLSSQVMLPWLFCTSIIFIYNSRFSALWERKGPRAFSRYGSLRVKGPEDSKAFSEGVFGLFLCMVVSCLTCNRNKLERGIGNARQCIDYLSDWVYGH